MYSRWNPWKFARNITLLILGVICFVVFCEILGSAIDRNIEIQDQQAIEWLEEYNATFYYSDNN